MVDNPKSFIILVCAFVISLTVIIGATKSYVAEVDRNSTFELSVAKPATKSVSSKTTTAPTTVSTSKKSVPTPSIIPVTKTNFVVYLNKSGFSPSKLTLKSGQSVRFINNVSSTMYIIAASSPGTTSLSELNQGKSVGYGGTYDFTFSKKGTFLYYNNNDRTKVGVITVE